MAKSLEQKPPVRQHQAQLGAKGLASLAKKRAAAARANERAIKRIQAYQNKTRQIGGRRI